MRKKCAPVENAVFKGAIICNFNRFAAAVSDVRNVNINRARVEKRLETVCRRWGSGRREKCKNKMRAITLESDLAGN